MEEKFLKIFCTVQIIPDIFFNKIDFIDSKNIIISKKNSLKKKFTKKVLCKKLLTKNKLKVRVLLTKKIVQKFIEKKN